MKVVPVPSKGSGWLANSAGMDWQAAALEAKLWDCCSTGALYLTHARIVTALCLFIDLEWHNFATTHF